MHFLRSCILFSFLISESIIFWIIQFQVFIWNFSNNQTVLSFDLFNFRWSLRRLDQHLGTSARLATPDSPRRSLPRRNLQPEPVPDPDRHSRKHDPGRGASGRHPGQQPTSHQQQQRRCLGRQFDLGRSVPFGRVRQFGPLTCDALTYSAWEQGRPSDDHWQRQPSNFYFYLLIILLNSSRQVFYTQLLEAEKHWQSIFALTTVNHHFQFEF